MERSLNTLETLESEVRGYVRSFPTVFVRSKGAEMWDAEDRRYVDFFAGAGALNYGHNPDALKKPLIDYLSSDRIVHALDMATDAKIEFIETFNEVILEPRNMKYKLQFCGPTGTNAVEAALKLARKVTGRTEVVAFNNAFHGMTTGALAVTGNSFKRNGAGVPLTYSTAMPFDGYLGEDVDTLDLLEKQLENSSSGLDEPAAVIVETIQAEGGVNVASIPWLQRLQKICKDHDVLFIVDDIQVGCGRTGKFFSFEDAGLDPDMICLSKSLSGYGQPMAIVLLRPEHDIWGPSEHNGTFRGFNPGFVTATAALDTFWRDDSLTKQVEAHGKLVEERLGKMAEKIGGGAFVRGRGLIQGLVVSPKQGKTIIKKAFAKGLIIETAGTDDEVIKILPPINIDEKLLKQGLDLLEEAVDEFLDERKASGAADEKQVVA